MHRASALHEQPVQQQVGHLRRALTCVARVVLRETAEGVNEVFCAHVASDAARIWHSRS